MQSQFNHWKRDWIPGPRLALVRGQLWLTTLSTHCWNTQPFPQGRRAEWEPGFLGTVPVHHGDDGAGMFRINGLGSYPQAPLSRSGFSYCHGQVATLSLVLFGLLLIQHPTGMGPWAVDRAGQVTATQKSYTFPLQSCGISHILPSSISLPKLVWDGSLSLLTKRVPTAIGMGTGRGMLKQAHPWMWSWVGKEHGVVGTLL